MLASVTHLASHRSSRLASLAPPRAKHSAGSGRRGWRSFCAQIAAGELPKANEGIYDAEATVANQFATDDVDARRQRKLGKLESAIFYALDTTPRNNVVVLKSKSRVFEAASLNLAIAGIQRRHPLLHSVLMSLPIVGPYFAISGDPIYVHDLPVRELLGETAEKTFNQHVQGVVDQELNVKFHIPYQDFLEKVTVARGKMAIDEALKAKGQLDETLGPAVTETDVAREIPIRPLLRATLVNGHEGAGQALVISIPQVIADGVSTINVVKEILEQTQVVNEVQRRVALTNEEEEIPDPKFLPTMNAMDSFYPKRVFGIGATWANFISWFKRWRYIWKLQTYESEKFAAWIPNASRVVRSLSAEIPAETVSNLKKLSREHDLNLSHTLSAATVAATHEVFFADSDEAKLPTQLWVNLRPHFDAPIDNKHIGLITGRIQGVVQSSVGETIWDLAKQVKAFDAEMPDEAFRSNRWLVRWLKRDRDIIASRPPSEKPAVLPIQTAPVTIGNMGVLQIPESLLEHFKIDSVSTTFGQSENTRFTSFATLPNGKMNISVTFPDLIFKRSDMHEFLNALCQHITWTSEGK